VWQVIDSRDAIELALLRVQPGAELGERRPDDDTRIHARQDLAAAVDHGLVLRAAGLVEQGAQLVVRHRLDAVDPEQGRFAANGLDLLHEPLEPLRGLRRLREDPTRAAQPHGAHALQLPPHPDPVPGRARWQRHEERQPAHRV